MGATLWKEDEAHWGRRRSRGPMKASTNRRESSGAKAPFGIMSAGVKEPGVLLHIYQCGLSQDGPLALARQLSVPLGNSSQ